MAGFINYKDTLFEQANLTPICGETTFEMIHKLRNYIKANAKSVYSNLVGGAHGNLGLVLTDTQYSIISPTPFVYPDHPGLLLIPDSTTAHSSYNIRIAHTDKVRMFREVTGVEQAFVQQFFSTVEESYLTDIRNRTT